MPKYNNPGGNVRILFTALPGFEPVAAMVPLAFELMRAGHHVVLATSATLTPVVDALGITSAAVGPRWTTARAWELSGEAPPRSISEERSCLGRAAVRSAMHTVSPVLKLAASHLPDLVIHDQYELAGSLAAEALGVRCATFHHQYDSTPVTARHALPTLRRKLGVSRDRNEPHELVLDSLPASLSPYPRAADDRLHWSIRPEPVHVPSRAGPARWHCPHDQPRILIALGTESVRRAAVLPPVLDALADLAVDALIADAPVPAHARGWARSVPGSAVLGLLPEADVMVTSGSSFLSVAALATSTPLLLVPRHPDEIYIAHRVTGTGSGLAVHVDHFDRNSVHAQLERLMNTTIYSDNAKRINEEIARMPTARQIAKDLAVR